MVKNIIDQKADIGPLTSDSDNKDAPNKATVILVVTKLLRDLIALGKEYSMPKDSLIEKK